MQVIVNCKKKPVDFSGDFRTTFRNRIAAPKSFLADCTGFHNGKIVLRKEDDGQEFIFDGDNTRSASVFIDGERVDVEIVIEGSADQEFSFVFSPTADAYDLGQDGVLQLAGDVESLAFLANIMIGEYIDPNPLGICPDDVPNIETLIEIRDGEGADYSYRKDDGSDGGEYEGAPYPDHLANGSHGLPVELSADADLSPFESISADGDLSLPYISYGTGDIDLATGELGGFGQDAYYNDEIVLDELVSDAFGDDLDLDMIEDIDPGLESELSDAFEADDESFGAARSAADELSDAYGKLDQFHEELKARRSAAIEDIRKIQEQYGDVVEIDNQASVKISPEDLTPLHSLDDAIQQCDLQQQEQIDIVNGRDDKEEDLVRKLEEEMDHLEKAGKLVDDEINDYDSLLAANRDRYQGYIANLEGADADTASLITGLMDLAAEQAVSNEKINNDLKRSNAMRAHCINKLAETSKELEACRGEVDEANRLVRKAEASKEKSDQFVADAKASVQKIVAAAKAKVRQSIQQVETMKARVQKAEAEVTTATNARDVAFDERDKAYAARDDALEKLTAEKAHTREMMEECDRQLEGFTNDVLAKMQDQIKRTSEAVEERNRATSKVTELESALAEANAQLAAAQTTVAKKDADLREARERREVAESEYGDLMLKYNQQTRNMQDTGQNLSKVESDLVFARGEVKRLEAELEKAIEARDRAISERLDAVAIVNASATSQVNEARTQRNEAVEDLINAKKEALAANADLLESMKMALAMPGGFGSRKTKLDAIEAAFDSFIDRTRAAQAMGADDFSDQPIVKAEVPVEEIISEEVPTVELDFVDDSDE